MPQRCEGAQRPQVLASQHGRLPLVTMDVQAGAGVWQLRKAFQGRRCNHPQLQHNTGECPASCLRLKGNMQEDAFMQEIREGGNGAAEPCLHALRRECLLCRIGWE